MKVTALTILEEYSYFNISTIRELSLIIYSNVDNEYRKFRTSIEVNECNELMSVVYNEDNILSIDKLYILINEWMVNN